VVDEIDDTEDELIDDEPPRRPWVLIGLTLVLAALAGWAGVQWKQAVDREEKLRVEMKAVYRETEDLRARAAQSQQRVTQLEQQVSTLYAERENLSKRVLKLEEDLSRARRTQKAPVKKPQASPQKR
jgi:predicted RNase H-like nuclease (RuvC/YqgF family)